MKISAIVPAYNAQRFLARAVKSLLDTGHTPLEVLVIDDGSTDSTLAVAQALQAAHPQQVRVLRHPGGVNRGVSASRNLGIREATGELVCFLDADDYVLQHRFQRALQILQGRPEVDGVYDATRVVIETPGADSGLGGDTNDGGTFAPASALEGEALLRELLRGYPWHPDAFLCRRTMFDRTGLFDENLRIAEDCNLWFRAAALCRVVPGSDLREAVAAYTRHAGNSYHYAIERKIDLVRAMHRAWPRVSAEAEQSTRLTFADGAATYLCNTLMVAREAARPDVAWATVWELMPTRLRGLLLRRAVLRQLAWLSKETLWRPRPASAA